MPTTTWTFAPRVTVPADLQAAVGGHPLVAQTLVRRGIRTPSAARAFLDPTHYVPAAPEALPDLAAAADRLEHAIRHGERILVWGDFDVDGQTATTVLVETLRDLGAQVRFHIPLRATEGHGIRPAALQAELARGVDVLLTCDTGITAHEAVQLAQQAGVDVLITDHHSLPERLPPAQARINPQRLPENHPLRPLPGVGVAWELAAALYARFDRAAEAEKHLDLVALGIVADVAPQVADARYLLQRGLQVLRHTPRLGLQALFRNAELQAAHLSEEHIAFAIAPRLNALGRLADANLSVDFFTTRDPTTATVLAERLEGLNLERRRLTEQITRAARAQLERDPTLLQFDALVLYGASWHPGVVGIVASRLAEEWSRPVVLLTGAENDLARGSARSIPGVDITAAIAAQAPLLTAFGGHPMAAGLALPVEHIPRFRQELSRTLRQRYGQRPSRPPLHIDGELPLRDLSPTLVADLERLAPFGEGNPPLTLLSRQLHLENVRPVGREGEHLLLSVRDDGEVQRVIWWRGADAELPEGPFDLAYTVRTSTYRGEVGLQIEWLDYLPTGERAVRLRRRLPEVIDLRGETQPLAVVQERESDWLLWREGPTAARAPGVQRHQLRQAEALVIWNAPCDRHTVRAALERVQPARVYVCAHPNPLDEPEALLRHLAGMLKYAIRARGGMVDIEELAAACGQRRSAIHAALEWLREKGLFACSDTPTGWRVSPAHAPPGPHLNAFATRLRDVLHETAAFRRFWQQAPVQQLVALMRAPHEL